MPQAARQKGKDKETKRTQGELACAECRRLKLKCDKGLPCSSCKRRGCSEICPNGQLSTGQGTRFVLADTEHLHEKIATMSGRIRQLEDALLVLQSQMSNDPHPLLSNDLLKIKSSIDLHSAVDEPEPQRSTSQVKTEEDEVFDAVGTLTIRDDGASSFYGPTAGQESLLMGERASSGTPPPGSSTSLHALTGPGGHKLDSNLLFPNVPSMDMDYLHRAHLPPWGEAQRLVHLYLAYAPWFFGAVGKDQIHNEILPLWYYEADAAVEPQSTFANANNSPSSKRQKRTAHDLALLFIIFCYGAQTDRNYPAAPENALSERYYSLTKAALNIDGILERRPSVSTVQVLAMLGIYEGLRATEDSIESTWAMMGLAARLAQSIGLHRDCARWNLTPAEVQKRRALFWEIFITDGWQALATGRLSSFALPFVDCELPRDPEAGIDSKGEIIDSFPQWKARFGANCVAPVVAGTLTSRAPKYSIILELDRKVRDMKLPQYTEGSPPVPGQGLNETMKYYMPQNYRNLTLLYIHRGFFVHAIESFPTEPTRSPYAPSFIVGCKTAGDMLRLVKEQFTLYPDEIARIWVLWTHAFSAAFMLYSVVRKAPTCSAARDALDILKMANDLFETAAPFGGRSVFLLPNLQRWKTDAEKTFWEAQSGLKDPIASTSFFRPASSRVEEWSIFAGKPHTLATRTQSQTDMVLSSSSAPTEGTPRITLNSDYRPNVHPHLMEQIQEFNSQPLHEVEHGRDSHYEYDSSSSSSLSPEAQPGYPVHAANEMLPPPLPPSALKTRASRQDLPHIDTLPRPSAPVPAYDSPASSQASYWGTPRTGPDTSYRFGTAEEVRSENSYSSNVRQQQYYDTHPQRSMEYDAPSPTAPSYRDSESPPTYQHRGMAVAAPPPSSHYAANDRRPSIVEIQYPNPVNMGYQSQGQLSYPSHLSSRTSQNSGQSTGYVSSTTPAVPQHLAPSYQQQQQPHYDQHHYYTPGGAMGGLAATDNGLQETWQTFMSQVGRRS